MIAVSRMMTGLDTRVMSDFDTPGLWMKRCHIHDSSSGCVDFGTVCKPCKRRFGIAYTTVGFLGKWFWVGGG